MARRAFLHVGEPKSGTTYLQATWWANRLTLRQHGLLLPGDSIDDHFWAAAETADRVTALREQPRRFVGSWPRLVADTGRWDGDVLISHEHFAPATPQRAAQALADLADAATEVHVLVTARDFVRLLPSVWQQRVKEGVPARFGEFCEQVRTHGPEWKFWRFHDLPRLLERWSAGLDPARVHLVVVPRPGAPRERLLDLTGQVLGIDRIPLQPGTQANDSLNPAEVEFVRRINASLPRQERDLQLRRLTKGPLTARLKEAGRPNATIALSPDMHSWAVERGNQMVDEIAGLGITVVGSLDDLRPDPAPAPGVDPDSVDDAEVAEVAVTAMASMLRHQRDRAVRRAGTRPRRRWWKLPQTLSGFRPAR